MYENIIKDRNITRLCHFTRTNNLPFILGDGIDSHNGIIANALITDASFLKPTDDNRVDGKRIISVLQFNIRIASIFRLYKKMKHKNYLVIGLLWKLIQKL